MQCLSMSRIFSSPNNTASFRYSFALTLSSTYYAFWCKTDTCKNVTRETDEDLRWAHATHAEALFA